MVVMLWITGESERGSVLTVTLNFSFERTSLSKDCSVSGVGASPPSFVVE